MRECGDVGLWGLGIWKCGKLRMRECGDVEMPLSRPARVPGAAEHPRAAEGGSAGGGRALQSPDTAPHTRELIPGGSRTPRGDTARDAGDSEELRPIPGNRLSRKSDVGRGKRKLEKLQDQRH